MGRVHRSYYQIVHCGITEGVDRLVGCSVDQEDGTHGGALLACSLTGSVACNAHTNAYRRANNELGSVICICSMVSAVV